MNALPWFRLYHRMIDDDKLRLLAFEDRWHFVALCCLKASGLLDDKSNLRDRKIAVKLGVQARELDEISRRLFEVGLVDENLSPTAWDDLQLKSDVSSSRVKSFREKQRLNTMKRECNVSETVQEGEEDKDRDKDREKREGNLQANTTPLLEKHVIEKWNEIANNHDLPLVKVVTEKRRLLIASAIASHSIDDWITAMDAVDASAFCHGKNARGWKASFDWMIGPDIFAKLMEGNYDG
jgi:hypothetical protein